MALCATLVGSQTLAATVGTVVAFGDEWTFSDSAFTNNQASTEKLTDNLADLLGGSSYLIATANSLAYGSSFQSYLASDLGKTVGTANTNAGLQAALGMVDAVFVAGTVGASLLNDLTDFVNDGGDLVVSLGTGNFGSSSGEATAWNPLLNQFGLTASSQWTTAPSITPLTITDGPEALDDGVSTMWWGYGNEISAFNGATDVALISGTERNNTVSAIGIAPGDMTPVPLPASLPLLLAGLGLAGVIGRRKAA